MHCFQYVLFSGLQSGGCGAQSIRLRPALVFQEHHADIFMDITRQAITEIDQAAKKSTKK